MIARAAGAASWSASSEETIDGGNVYFTLRADDEPDTFAHTFNAEANKVQHIAEWDPQFVLADIAAKRQIIDLAESDGVNDDFGSHVTMRDVLQLLALPHASHPAYRESWKP